VLVLLAAALPLLMPSGLPATDATHPNIVLVVVDALRPDHLSCYTYDRPTSPNIDRLAAEGVVFETAITQASWTKASFASLLTSRYPFQTAVINWFSILPDTLTTLQEVLGEHGYETICVVNMVGMADKYGLLTGFRESSVTGKYERRAAATTDDALALMEKARRPFFTLIHYFDAHSPYRPSPKSLALFAGSEPVPFGEIPAGLAGDDSTDEDYSTADLESAFDPRLYDACIRDVDDQIGRIADFLASQGLAENTVIIVTADHGEAFAEHGHFSHGWSAYDEEIRIPLVVHYPAHLPAGRRIGSQVRDIDLFPSILYLAGIDPLAQCEGTNILGQAGLGTDDRRRVDQQAAGSGPRKPFFPPEVAYCETSMRSAVPGVKAVRTSDRKVIVEPLTGVIQVFDLSVDPGETDNLWPDRVDSRDPLLEMLAKVPGFSVRGWRLAFTGAKDGDRYQATVVLPAHARVVDVEKIWTRERFNVETSADRRSIHVTGGSRELDLLVFDTEPPDVEIEITVRREGSTTLPIYIGRRAGPQPGDVFRFSPADASGRPGSFEQCRESQTAAAFIWWAPGQRYRESAEPAGLTPEELKRLRSLGYIQ
jgi:arylsulfatase A-like enzyme